jgi:hypothetical protein
VKEAIMPSQREYLAFDIETAAVLPDKMFDWRSHRPLGISCAATLVADDAGPHVWHGRTPEGTPAGRMQQQEARCLVEYLAKMANDGYSILTWNGLAFDFDILAEESGERDICKRLAWGHVDMMFQVFCRQGYRVALGRAAQGMKIPGKPEGMSGIMAPRLWAEGHHQKVLDYVSQDVRITMQLAKKCEQCGQFRWVTQKGTRHWIDLSEGLLTAKEAFCLPQPDTSWMQNPPSREEFIAWLK